MCIGVRKKFFMMEGKHSPGFIAVVGGICASLLLWLAATLLAASDLRTYATSMLTIMSPRGGMKVSGMVTIAAQTGSKVNRVSFYINNNRVASSLTPFSLNWDSKTVGDGPQVIVLRGFASNGTLITSAATNVNVQNAAVSPSPTPLPTATPTAQPSPISSQTGPAGYPLTEPINFGNPANFGAQCDGVTDDTDAFQRAVNSGNVYVSESGTCLIAKQILLPSNTIFQCGPNVTLKTNIHSSHDTGLLRLQGTTHSSILGCSLVGTNNAVPPVLDDNQGNSLISLFGASHNLIAANSCKWAFGNACIHIADLNDGSGDYSDSNIIRNNAFGPTALYGLAIVVGNNNQILLNDLVNASLGSEANPGQPSDSNANNIYDRNRLTKNLPNQSVSSFGVFLTGGTAVSGLDYSSNVVSNNYVSGSGSIIKQDNHNGAKPASYRQNSCLDGCTLE
jgi:hypothetical protein